MRRVVLVTGPPCSGKTTYVQRHAQHGDLILDQDRIGARAMNRAITQVAAMRDGTAWIIRCAPGPRARNLLAQQVGATERVHLIEPQPTLIVRATARPTTRRHIAAIADWFKREQQDQTPKTKASRVKGSTTERGYGWSHQQARLDAIKHMPDGQPCTRCGLPMWKAGAKLLDLDHSDDRAGYRGMAHRACNRRAGQAAGTRARRHTSTPRPSCRSREW